MTQEKKINWSYLIVYRMLKYSQVSYFESRACHALDDDLRVSALQSIPRESGDNREVEHYHPEEYQLDETRRDEDDVANDGGDAEARLSMGTSTWRMSHFSQRLLLLLRFTLTSPSSYSKVLRI
ncbi:hypothetical protein PIB30_053466 [Stylosanthes scabra]|uniref:Uncharacterized protein n=1 Tax=Stylosanthes scabra TaxID=79078 RepID=A0ABU6VHE8_9FABA|nr:hypothetical protein [Stylosanthes scabra]